MIKDKKSIHLQNFLDFPKKFENLKLDSKWNKLLKIRDVCNLSIEEKRATKVIGSSLEAELSIKLNKEMSELTKDIDLSELCITSSVEIKNDEIKDIVVETKKAKGKKCSICWKISEKPCPRHN